MGSATLDEHVRHLECLFQDIRAAGLKLNYEKTKELAMN